MNEEYLVDPDRVVNYNDMTGMFVRAKDSTGKWDSYDIAALDKPSLKAWLRSRGGENEWAENVVFLLLGYD